MSIKSQWLSFFTRTNSCANAPQAMTNTRLDMGVDMGLENIARLADMAGRDVGGQAARFSAILALAISTATAASRQYASAPIASENSSFSGAPPTSTI